VRRAKAPFGNIYFCLMEGLDAVEPCPGLEIHVPVFSGFVLSSSGVAFLKEQLAGA
jgi:hypothetical protein